jgi:arylsulfatase
VYEHGWDALREARLARQKDLDICAPDVQLSERDPLVPKWEDEPYQKWQIHRMQVYAAMVEELDTAIGRVIASLEASEELDDTLVIFLADNGAAADPVPLIDLERFRTRTDILRHVTRDGRTVHIGDDPLVMPGDEDTYAAYGRGWANVSNTPFRLYKIWAHEGGVSTPFIARWPAGGLEAGRIVREPFQLVHVLPTLLDVVGAAMPEERNGVPVHRLPGMSMLGSWLARPAGSQPLWWEHCGNAGIQAGRWKLVRQYDWPWELYDIDRDRTESEDLSDEYPDVVADLSAQWQWTADRVGVIPFRTTLDVYRRRGMDWRYAVG